jgi:hypothetical protein
MGNKKPWHCQGLICKQIKNKNETILVETRFKIDPLFLILLYFMFCLNTLINLTLCSLFKFSLL